MTLDQWLHSHQFLGEVARVQARIDEAVEDATPILPAPPDWDDYAEDFVTGVPLLQSQQRIDLEPAGRAVMTTLASLAFDSPSALLMHDAAAQVSQFQRQGVTPDDVVEWLLGDDSWQPERSGLLRSVGWLTMSASMRLLLNHFSAWKDDERWLRRYCPACGSLPSMAQLAGVDPGRKRFLSCGRCSTQWRYTRTMCPFCEKDEQRLASLAIDNESGLRIDYCESCRGYLKTYAGQGDEPVMLADWTSLHLDHLALERGLMRAAASLYDIDASSVAVYP